MQRGNAACIVGAVPPSVDRDELFYLYNVKSVLSILIIVTAAVTCTTTVAFSNVCSSELGRSSGPHIYIYI